MNLAGVTIDVFVNDAASWTFWESMLGRNADLRPDAGTAEWKLVSRPVEIALRVRVDAARAGKGRLGLGVDDLAATAAEIANRIGSRPTIETKPNVIATLELHDPDGNAIVFWQDLLVR